MRSIITGVAGFIGSHLAEKLLGLGHEIVGVDKFLDNYARHFKDSNLSHFANHPSFKFINDDLVNIELSQLLDQTDYVFHLAAQPGVRSSWGREFSQYSHNNILATQVLLEACKQANVRKFVYASSSSVYGDTDDLPMRENGGTRPVSPYGVSKLAAEHLCYLYWKSFGIPTVSLRFFTVYGPRQRPDMFFHILMRRLLLNDEIPLYDDGGQSRDFTFCADIVEGLVRAAFYPGSGEVFNLGGGGETTLLKAIRLTEKISGRKARLTRFDRQRGDVRRTRASLDGAKKKLGYGPSVSLEEGLSRQWEWMAAVVK
jgi:nucleoside-diphosphate-sugar epimerase